MAKLISYICNFCNEKITEAHEENKKPGVGIGWLIREYPEGKREIFTEVKFAESERHICEECLVKYRSELEKGKK